jgi:5,10-methylenetetrahydrofolate reductase
MHYGPCGGVKFDGRCEVDDHRCVFLDLPTVRWDQSTPVAGAATAAAADTRALLEQRQVVIADFPARALDQESARQCAAALAGSVDFALSGDSGAARVQFSPSFRVQLIQGTGLPVWIGLNNRDRNRVALEGELAALAAVGVAGVHCVTGDHTATGDRPDAKPVFDLDSTETAALARSFGHLVSVGESPTTPPVDRRAARLIEKERAGAEVCFVDHCGGWEAVDRFVHDARALGSAARYIPCVPVVIDRGSAELLKSFTTLVLPDDYLDRILSANDPRTEGIAAAVELSEAMLALDGIAGVDLSGGPSHGGELAFAEALAEIGERLAL